MTDERERFVRLRGKRGETLTYILDGHTPVPEPDTRKWGGWMGRADRTVRKEAVGGVEVSTVFLGLDHSYDDEGPMLFETMVFGGLYDLVYWRCRTWDEAEAQHARVLAMVS